jgi:multiple sugar transport system substrate-binding protein
MDVRPTGFSRRTMLKGAGAAGVLAASGGALAACSTGDDTTKSSSDPKSLNLMIPSWVDAKFIADVMQTAAGGAIGAKINLVTTDDGTYPAQAAAAQKAGQAPDLLMWTAQGIAAFLGAGVKLAPLDDYAKDEDKTAFYEQDYVSNSIDNVLLGLGYRSDCRGIAYRDDFAKTPPPESYTFDQFGDWITGLNGKGRIAFGYEAKPGDGRSSSNILPMIWSTGAQLVTKEDGKWKIGFQPEQMTQVLQFYYDTVHTWKVSPGDVANWGYQETDSKFAKGTMAAYSAGPFVTANTQKYPETRQHLKIAPLPYAVKPSNFWEELSFMIHADSKKKDLAWKFIEAMRSVDIQNTIVARTADAWLGVRVAANDAITDPILKSFATLLKQAQVPEPVNAAPIFNGAILPAMGAVALKGTKPADATVTLMKNMQSALDQLNA